MNKQKFVDELTNFILALNNITNDTPHEEAEPGESTWYQDLAQIKQQALFLSTKNHTPIKKAKNRDRSEL